MGGKSAARASILRIPMVAGEREFFSSIRIFALQIACILDYNVLEFQKHAFPSGLPGSRLAA